MKLQESSLWKPEGVRLSTSLRVLRTIAAAGESGLTADEVAELLEWSSARVSGRVSELQQRGRIVDSGRRRDTRCGYPAVVWRVP